MYLLASLVPSLTIMQEDINCHLVLKAEGDIWPMKVLFEESVSLLQ
jgi:hypothetical protein